MDIQTIDNQYRQMQDQSQQTVQELRSLAMKLQGAAQAGNQDAREWLLDLKSVALAIQSEQNQVANLLQALHNFVENQNQMQQQGPWGSQQQPMQQQPYPQQNYGGYPQQQQTWPQTQQHHVTNQGPHATSNSSDHHYHTDSSTPTPEQSQATRSAHPPTHYHLQ